MGKKSRAKLKKGVVDESEVKKYPLTIEEKTGFKRILSTMGFFNAALEGLQLSLQVLQAQIENGRKVGTAPEGFVLQTKIDIEDGFLCVRKVKKEEPKLEVKEEEKK